MRLYVSAPFVGREKLEGAGKMASATRKSIAPFVRLFLYYDALVLIGVLIRQMWPDVYLMFAKGIEGGIGPVLFGDQPPPPTGPLTDAYPALSTALVIIGALLVMLPVAWVYMLTKKREGYDRSVVQTLIALPTAICGVVVIVQNSFALAFALAGIVAAVRFRNTLKDTKDAVYVFLAIGVGLAAGVQQLDVALIVSLLFNLTILWLWATNFGNVYTGQPGDPVLHASVASGGVEQLAEGSEKVREHLKATEGLPKGKRPNAILTVRVSDSEAAQPMIEAAIEPDTKVWQLVDTREEDENEVTLEYLIRKKKPVPTATFLDKLEAQCSPHVLGVEYRELAGVE
jgi:hypothetical protein